MRTMAANSVSQAWRHVWLQAHLGDKSEREGDPEVWKWLAVEPNGESGDL